MARSPIPPKAAHDFANGQSLNFAVALSRITGWPVHAVMLDEAGAPSVWHAWCVNAEGRAVDVAGVHAKATPALEPWPGEPGAATIGPVPEEAIERRVGGSRYAASQRTRARRVILDHKNFFGVPLNAEKKSKEEATVQTDAPTFQLAKAHRSILIPMAKGAMIRRREPKRLGQKHSLAWIPASGSTSTPPRAPALRDVEALLAAGYIEKTQRLAMSNADLLGITEDGRRALA